MLNNEANVVDGLLDDVLDDFVNSYTIFTAYDVTKAVRDLTSIKFRHDEVRGSIHTKMLKFTNYAQRQHATWPAFEYFPITIPINSVNPVIFGTKPSGQKYYNVRGTNGKFVKNS